MADFLDRMARSSRARVQAAEAREPEGTILARARAASPPLPLAVQDFGLIAELKRRSPAAGGLASADFDREDQLDAYAAGGAAAVSVLTEPDEFNGSLADLRDAAARLRGAGCPVMRKDFVVASYQVIEARANGASGVLLIAAMLGDAALAELSTCAAELGLFVLLEAFDERDLERIERIALPAIRAEAKPSDRPQPGVRGTIVSALVGVNSRDLRTLAVDFERFSRLAARLPAGVPAVAESGIDNPAEIGQVARLGYRLALVGSALMRPPSRPRAGRAGDHRDAADPRNAARSRVAELVAAGRDAAREQARCS